MICVANSSTTVNPRFASSAIIVVLPTHGPPVITARIQISSCFRYAKAKATVGARSFAFSGGQCTVSGPYFTVNIGVHLINKVVTAKPGPSSYFGVTITPSDAGVHLKQALLWTSGGKDYEVLANRITLNPGRKSGYFSGKSLNGQKVKGTFIC